MIETISRCLPYETNKRILHLLINDAKWFIAGDHNKPPIEKYTSLEKGKDSGFSYITYDYYNNIDLPTNLNIYANTIYDFIKANTKIYKIGRPIRYLWNYYKKGSDGDWHIDNGKDPQGKYFTFIYSLNHCDGGTSVKTSKVEKYYRSSPSEAICFPSNTLHKGHGPKRYLGRFNLTIMSL